MAIKKSMHGMTRTQIHRAWCNMIQRYTNPNNTHWPRYGGRGIKVCQQWRESFTTFLKDMGLPPSSKHELDRFPDNNGNYEPGNVRWATRRQQCRNMQRTIMIAYCGETKSLRDWADQLGLNVNRVYFRLRAGASFEDAIKSYHGGRGEGRPNAKLSEADVRLARELRAAGSTLQEIAGRFGVCYTAIQKIIAGQSWRHTALTELGRVEAQKLVRAGE